MPRKRKHKDEQKAKEPRVSKNPHYIPKKMRLAVMERDNHQCTRCGVSDELIIHHIIPVFEGGTTVPENLTVLCMACHKSVHLERGDEFAEDMAMTRNGWERGKKDYAYKRVNKFHINQVSLQSDFGLSDSQVVALGRVCKWYDGYPSLSNLADGTVWTELRLAAHLEVLRSKGLVIVTKVDGKSALYRPNRKVLDAYFGLEIGFMDHKKQELYKKTVGRFWGDDGSITGMDYLAVANAGGLGKFVDYDAELDGPIEPAVGKYRIVGFIRDEVA